MRRLVDNLRPLALDRLGLVDALREQILSISSGEGTPDDGLVVVIEASPDLRSLPPAVETAVYRIALEAFVNVRRHANARSCTIRLTRGASLHLEVIDDGDGFFAGACPGVGIASMQERAAELGGTCTVVRGASRAAPRCMRCFRRRSPSLRSTPCRAPRWTSRVAQISRLLGTLVP